MARTSYTAPGVYVEEVPSAQKAIAGVGTNTVAFIGVVPDEIEYPVPNDKYDPGLAEKLAKGPELHKVEIEKLEAGIQQLLEEKKQVEQKLAQTKTELGKPDLKDNQKKSLQKRQEDENKDLSRIDSSIESKKTQLNELKKPPAGAEEYLRPYKLPFEKFIIEVPPGQPKLCTNFSEYTKRFGPFSADDPKNMGQALYSGHRDLTHAVAGFFKNGGTRCFVTRVKSKNVAELERALAALESIDAVAIVATPGLDGNSVWDPMVEHCDRCEDRFAIFDCPPQVETDGELDLQLLNYDSANNVLPKNTKHAAFYFPYLAVVDPAKQLQDLDPARKVQPKYRGRIYVPPSGHIAGIYARTDEERGVHKAPANAGVIGAMNVKYYIGRPKHELLNPQGVNVIRNINGNILVWGARTVGGDKNSEWKYVNVRRLFLFLRESIDEGTQWVVFEPNDAALWGKIRRNVSAFLTNVWRAGALFGASPQEAFYVKCDEETNPPEVREAGQVVTEIGVAIVRPAEFVIFRIMQAGSLSSL